MKADVDRSGDRAGGAASTTAKAACATFTSAVRCLDAASSRFALLASSNAASAKGVALGLPLTPANLAAAGFDQFDAAVLGEADVLADIRLAAFDGHLWHGDAFLPHDARGVLLGLHLFNVTGWPLAAVKNDVADLIQVDMQASPCGHVWHEHPSSLGVGLASAVAVVPLGLRGRVCLCVFVDGLALFVCCFV
jgi:hypothetical protein